jgi:type I restriction enzyme S subunit
MKPGYKQTEVGVIPEGWEVKALSEITEAHRPISYGIVQTGPSITNGVPCLRVVDINDGQINKDDLITTTRRISDAYRRTILKDGDLVMPLRGKVGDVGLIDKDLEGANLTRGVGLIAIRSEWSPLFFQQVISAHSTRKRLEQAMNGSALQEIPIASLRGFQIPLPPLPEQRAIAAALSEVDALLAALDRLIAKKRDLKQAAMQQLLTGQTRLPGFEGEWVVKRLGDLGAIYGGLAGKTKKDFRDGSSRYITFMNVMSNVVIDCSTFERVAISTTESQNRTRKGDLFFNGSSETPEEVAMCAVLLEDVEEVYLNSFCFGFRFRENAEADGVFLAYYLRSREGRELMKSLAQGSTRYNLSKPALLNSQLRLPFLPEQTAIAAVLSDMDAELAALEQRREKTRALKQGMMQELLTGRTRLV